MDLIEEDILGESAPSHWYYRSKASALRRYVHPLQSRTILDVGAGSGLFSRFLLKETAATISWCVDPGYVSDRDESVGTKTIRFRREGSDVAPDLVLMMDVLEHVDDDSGLIREYLDRAPSGSHLLITVPAFQFLWSGHDLFLKHRRRYTIHSLTRLVQGAGLEVVRCTYYFGFVFVPAALTRLGAIAIQKGAPVPKTQLHPHGPLVNGFLTAICKMELPFLFLNRLAGLSVFCLARKP